MPDSSRRSSIELSPLLREVESENLLENELAGPSTPRHGHYAHTVADRRSDSENLKSGRGFNMKQLSALCFLRIVEPIAFSQIFPYINKYIEHLHVTDDPSKVGFYSGMVESLFALAQVLSIYSWAKASDKFGRRPIVFAGTMGISLSALAFGLSNSFIGIVISRFAGGLFAGTVSVLHSVLAEITANGGDATAYPIYGLMWPIGMIVAPFIGGNLSEPADKWDIFDNPIFRARPFCLPGITTGIIGLSIAMSGIIFLKETAPMHVRKHQMRKETYEGSSNHEIDQVGVENSIVQLMRIPEIRKLCLSGGVLTFIATGWDVVFVLFCYSAVADGGLALSTSQIGNALTSSGVVAFSLQLLVMPTILRRFDPATIYSACMVLFPLNFMVFPFLNILARTAGDSYGTKWTPETVGVWIGLGVVLALSRVAALAFSVSMILVKHKTPNPASLGATNGLVQLCMCLTRSLSPTLVSSAFVYSQQHQLWGGNLWVVIMVSVSVIGWRISCTISGKSGGTTRY